MRSIYPVVLAVGLLLVGVVFWLQFDDALLPEVGQIVADVELRQDTESEAFSYLTGIGAAKGEDVVAYGRAVFEELNALGDRWMTSSSDDPELEFTPDKLDLPERSEPFYCSTSEDGCLAGVMADEQNGRRQLNERREIHQRYITFIQHDEYNSLTTPSLSEPWPSYIYLTVGNRLRVFDLLSSASAGQPEYAWDALMADIVKLKRQLELGDRCLHKTVMAKLISSNIDALIYLKTHYLPEKIARIDVLSRAELSYDAIVARDIYMTYELFSLMEKRPDIIRRDGKLPAWVVNIGFKKNKSMNQAYIGIEAMKRILDLPANEFAIEAPDFAPDSFSKFDWSNIVGSSLASITLFDLRTFKADLHDLNAKIVLFNNQLGSGSSRLVNPYYPDAVIEPSGSRELCLEGPFPDDRIRRCLIIAP